MRLWPSHTSMLAGVVVILACGMSPLFAMAQSSGVTPKDVDRTQDAQRMKPVGEGESSSKDVRYEQVLAHPTEGYFAGFAGYTFGGTLDADGIGLLNGANFANHNLAGSVVYGAKAGGFSGVYSVNHIVWGLSYHY